MEWLDGDADAPPVVGRRFRGRSVNDAMPDKEPRIIAGRLAAWREAMEANLAGIRELLEA